MGELTPEQRAEDVLSTFRRNAQSASIKAIIATAIRDAEERGRLAERERCAGIIDEAIRGEGKLWERPVADPRGDREPDCSDVLDRLGAAIRAAGERESER